MPDALRSLDIERGRHLPAIAGVDIDGHRVDDTRNEGGELFVHVEWHHRWPVDWVSEGRFHVECIALAHGPVESTTFHVLPDYVTVIGDRPSSSVEARLIGYVAGLFAADEEVAA